MPIILMRERRAIFLIGGRTCGLAGCYAVTIAIGQASGRLSTSNYRDGNTDQVRFGTSFPELDLNWRARRRLIGRTKEMGLDKRRRHDAVSYQADLLLVLPVCLA